MHATVCSTSTRILRLCASPLGIGNSGVCLYEAVGGTGRPDMSLVPPDEAWSLWEVRSLGDARAAGECPSQRWPGHPCRVRIPVF